MNSGLTNHLNTQAKIAAIRPGDSILIRRRGIVAGAQFLEGKVERIFRDASGHRVFSIGADYMLVDEELLIFSEE